MRVLDRYLIRGFLYPFVYCLALFITLFVVVDAFNHLDEFLKSAVTPLIVLTYYGYFLPAILVHTVPIAVLVAVLFKLGNLNRHNEIVALKASGVSSTQILMPYLFVGALLSFGVFLASETLLPKMSLTSQSIMEGVIEKGGKGLKNRAIKNVTLVGAGNRMIFARELEIETGTLYDVSILEDDPAKPAGGVLKAKKARFESEDHWTFTDAVRYTQNRRGDLVDEPVYSPTLTLTMPERPEDFIRGSSQSEFMSAKELKNHIEHLKGNPRVARRLWVDFHQKIAFPFVTFVVMLIGAPLAMRTERGSALVGIGTSLIVVVVYYALNSICLAMGKGGWLDPFVAAWFSNAVFASVGLYLIRAAH